MDEKSARWAYDLGQSARAKGHGMYQGPFDRATPQGQFWETGWVGELSFIVAWVRYQTKVLEKMAKPTRLKIR